jgi:hypothetical protein
MIHLAHSDQSSSSPTSWCAGHLPPLASVQACATVCRAALVRRHLLFFSPHNSVPEHLHFPSISHRTDTIKGAPHRPPLPFTSRPFLAFPGPIKGATTLSILCQSSSHPKFHSFVPQLPHHQSSFRCHYIVSPSTKSRMPHRHPTSW